jgi:hypothetical protein
VFERCDENTLAVFNTALAEARSLGHNYVGTEHLLLALMRHREFLPGAVAALLPRDVRVVTAALAAPPTVASGLGRSRPSGLNPGWAVRLAPSVARSLDGGGNTVWARRVDRGRAALVSVEAVLGEDAAS